MADPLATSQTKRNYDVFLSFRGEDTRGIYTVFLYNALRREGFKTFMDNENIRTGETIRPQLLKAIEESRVSFIVLSENYAASTWCLDELVKIMECQKDVCPIFYKVEPSDVRHLRKSYGKAMAAHEEKFGCDSDKVRKWRSALSSVSEIAGYPVKEGDEFKSIQDIVSKVATKVSRKQLYIEENAVGLQFRVAELKAEQKPFLDIEYDDSTFMLGILGPGGIGKTTLAKALYNSICNQFEGACFLFNVGKSSNNDEGKVRLQKMLLSELFEGGNVEFGSVDKGICIMKDRLCTKRVLIVLDDVDNIEQLKELAGGCDWFGPGSRIIITTRDRHVLVAHQVKNIYDMKFLNDRESLELFCHNAFKMTRPAKSYEALSNRAICYAKGLPLALKVIGSNLIGKNLKQWKSALDKYENNPHRDIQSILEISYDNLESNEKEIFLDIACFFNGQRLRYVKRILDGCEFHTKDGIKILVDKSLITIENGYLRMHDLIQDMGREVVKQEAPKEASQRSRLWFCQDVRKVLTENIGNSKIEGILFDCPKEVNRIDTAFEKMKELRILIVRNTNFSFGPINLPNQLRLLDWKGYPSKSLPSGFCPEKIAVFNLSCSSLVLNKPFQGFDHLTYMNFSYCQSITQFPDVSGAKNLRELILNGCKKLVKVDESVGFLPNLVRLSASECTQLRSFPPRICLPSLKYLYFDLCRRLAHFPAVVGEMDKLVKICMKHTAISELPHSFANLIGLSYLDMTGCKELKNLPSNLFILPNFATLKIGECSQLRKSLASCKGSLSIVECWPNLETLHFNNASLTDEDLYIIMQSFPNLKDLNVSSNYVVSFPACSEQSICLTSLDVSYCMKLQEIPELPSSVQKVDARHCNSLAADTSSMLWSQVRKERNRLEVVMPRTDFPKWLDYCDQGGMPIFWARGKFPPLALAFVFEKVVYQNVGLHLFIDGELVHVHHQQCHKFNLAEDHVLLCDLQVLFSDEGWKGLDARVGHDSDWKCVQVMCEPDMIPRQWGVYVYKQEANMDDIQFTRPNPERPGARSFFEYADLMIPADDEEEDVGSAIGSGLEDLEAPIQEEDCIPGCSAIMFKIKRCFVMLKSKIQKEPEKPEAPEKPKPRPSQQVPLPKPGAPPPPLAPPPKPKAPEELEAPEEPEAPEKPKPRPSPQASLPKPEAPRPMPKAPEEPEAWPSPQAPLPKPEAPPPPLAPPPMPKPPPLAPPLKPKEPEKPKAPEKKKESEKPKEPEKPKALKKRKEPEKLEEPERPKEPKRPRPKDPERPKALEKPKAPPLSPQRQPWEFAQIIEWDVNFPFASSSGVKDVDEEHYSSEDEEDNADVDKQVPPSLSESLQTLVENFKRAVAQKLENGPGLELEDGHDNDHDYMLESLAEKILSDEDGEEEEVEE